MRTRVGYSGGSKARPTYRDLGDHTETLQVDYDPERVSYEDLLEVFSQSHDASARPPSRQYASIVFVHDEEQARAARAWKERQEGRVLTEIVPASAFYLAEDYHQKYRLQNTPPFAREFRAVYSSMGDLVDSTAAARVNGILGGHGSFEQLTAS